MREPRGESVRAIRELGLALRSGPFRVALVLSLIVHLLLLAVIGRWGGAGRERGGGRSIPLMRVRLLAPAPDAVPGTPAGVPEVGPPRRGQP